MLFSLADRYQVHSVKHTVSNHLQESVNIENACQFAIIAHMHGEDRLLDTALRTMKQGLAQVRESPVWKEIENKYPVIMTKLLMLDLDK